MPKLIPQQFTIRFADSGSAFLVFTTPNRREFSFEIKKDDVPSMRDQLAQAFGFPLPNPAKVEQTESAQQAGQIGEFELLYNQDDQLILLRFRQPDNRALEITLPIPRVEQLFDSLGKALTIAKAAAPATKQ